MRNGLCAGQIETPINDFSKYNRSLRISICIKIFKRNTATFAENPITEQIVMQKNLHRFNLSATYCSELVWGDKETLRYILGDSKAPNETRECFIRAVVEAVDLKSILCHILASTTYERTSSRVLETYPQEVS